MIRKNKYRAIGLMSGTSLDGLDLACCEFQLQRGRWHFTLEASKTIAYTSSWRKRLMSAHLLSGLELQALHSAYGEFLGNACRNWITKNHFGAIDLIASHGHTIFHQPQRKFTFQLGDGQALHSIAALPVVYDFRSLDVHLGGQGAPLVPTGDALLFSEYDACLNLGGIANISFAQKDPVAFDLCFCNMALNYLANKIGLPCDVGGRLAAKGTVDASLLRRLETINQKNKSKLPSLAREGFEQHLQPLLDDESISLEDRLHTTCLSIAKVIASSLPRHVKKILITGGGAHNAFLLNAIRAATTADVIVPPKPIINFKEAIIFAFLGVLRVRGDINVKNSVTGARRDSCSGVVIG